MYEPIVRIATIQGIQDALWRTPTPDMNIVDYPVFVFVTGNTIRKFWWHFKINAIIFQV